MANKRLVFLDTGVLIAAARGIDEVAIRAFETLNDPEVEFASSIFIQLETLPKAKYNKREEETAFYDEFFQGVTVWVEPSVELAQSALSEALTNGLGAMDALHVASAISCQAHEIITTEKTTKPISRVTSIQVHSISQ